MHDQLCQLLCKRVHTRFKHDHVHVHVRHSHCQLRYVRVASNSWLECPAARSEGEEEKHNKHKAEDGEDEHTHHQVHNSVWRHVIVWGKRNIIGAVQHVA